ncbi:hypothetical protein MTO96_011577 [Rhipicephalus appendiculatus]
MDSGAQVTSTTWPRTSVAPECITAAVSSRRPCRALVRQGRAGGNWGGNRDGGGDADDSIFTVGERENIRSAGTHPTSALDMFEKFAEPPKRRLTCYSFVFSFANVVGED